MADYESQIVSKCVQHGGIEKLLAQGISVDHFSDEENKELWEFLSTHVRQYKTPPTFDTVRERFPEYKWQTTPEPLEFVKDQFIASVKRREAIDAFREMAEVLDEDKHDDIMRIEEIFLDKAKELAQIIPATNISKFSNMQQRIDLYKARKAAGQQVGMLYGFNKLDEATLGVHPHQYVTIAGFTGMGKSTTGLILSVNWYASGFSPMIISLEMDDEEVYRKVDAIAVGLQANALREMELPHADVKKWEEFAARCEKAANDIIVVDVDRATPETVYAETARWNPDITIVDYVQLMDGPKFIKNKWERIDHCSRELKRQARTMRIPVVGISQTNADGETEGATLGNLGGAKSIGHHSDVVIGLHQDDEMEAMKKMDLTIQKNRGGPKDVTQSLFWDQANADFREWKGSYAYGEN